MTTGLTEKNVPNLIGQTRAEISKNLDPDYDPFDTVTHDADFRQ